MKKFKLLLPTLLILLFEAAIGVMLLIDGEKFTKVIFIIFGGLLLLGGLVTLFRSIFAGRNGGRIPTGQLILAIVLIAVGGFFVAASDSVLSIVSAVTLVIGIIMACNGIFKLVEFFSIRQHTAVAWFALFGALLTIVLGIVIVFNPFGATQAMWTILGVMVIVSAVFDLIALIIFGAALKNADVTVASVNVEAKDIDGE